ncbi:RNA-guided endonuclease InsQ/TnpB family protein [Massilia sp. S19_KUP03_FR1]|uniref:RNA-guided endonuclease InsQ/TnpB family protein n=1 Tax=Massilia sp. S19_KUP03_FR1 TaxID=3025503 RepID=UPI002FCD7C5F
MLAHRIRLNPNNVQATSLSKAAGVARFAYNWALNEWKRQYDVSQTSPALPKPNEAALRRQLNAIKRSSFPWMLEVTKNAPQMAIMQLGDAFQNFFSGRSHYPTFRQKGRDDRFTLTNDQFNIEGKRIRIPKLGWVRMRESLRYTGQVVSATVARHAGHWYASITVDTPDDMPLPQAENQGAVGVDLGITALATLSTGEKVLGPKALTTLLKKLRRLGRCLTRKVNGSRNRAKARQKLARLHARIADLRSDSLHKLTTELTRRFHSIVIEDLNVKGMLKNHRLARAISDMGFHEFRRQLMYKAARCGGEVFVADRWYPSSKLCSSCGDKLERLNLGVRQWICPVCHAMHDRDVNAAINLRNLAVSSTAAACGGDGSGHACKRKVKPAPAKQESNGKKT